MITTALRCGVGRISAARAATPHASAARSLSIVAPRFSDSNVASALKDADAEPAHSLGRVLDDVMSATPAERPAQRPIYLDAQSTSPVDPRVLDKMMPFFINQYGNPHSRTHAYGWETEAAVDEARGHIARLVNADPKEMIFTSGATESNNTALKGVARFYKSKKNHIITTQTEHKCVLDSCRALQEEGFEVTYLPVDQHGYVSLEDIKKALRPTTSIVSIMTVNNEIGVIQPIRDIGELLKTYGTELAKELGRGTPKPFFHTDAAQALGKIPLDVDACGVDLMSISSHKIYGPKGLGAIYVRRRPRVRLEPLISGGGQERGLRSGTLPTPHVAGFGEAARIAMQEMAVRMLAADDELRSLTRMLSATREL